MPVFVDDFDDGVVDPEWGSWNSAGSSVAETDGLLTFSIAPSNVEWVSAGLYTQPHDFVGGQVRARLVPFQPPLEVVGIWLTIFNDACEVQIAAENSLVLGMSAGVWFDGVPVDTTAPIWLQLRVDADGDIHWEWSDDATSWTEVHTEPAPCDFSVAQSALFAGDMHDLADPVVRAVESYERCEAP
jgi:hypothetical protein